MNQPRRTELCPPGDTVPAGASSVTERVTRVLAANPGPMTLEGTNTWLLAEPGSGRAVCVDPGPADDRHLDAIESAAAGRGLHISLIVITHRHRDHAEAAPALARRTGAVVRAADPAYRLGDEGLTDGETVDLDGLELRVLTTPGHSSDSVCLVLTAEQSVLTGDHVLGRGTTVVAHPDGVLADYLDSLHRLRAVCAELDCRTLLPGHGPLLPDPVGVLDYYLAHRVERLAQVQAALDEGDRTVDEVVAHVYADVPQSLWPAARLSVRAQLAHLGRPDPPGFRQTGRDRPTCD